MTELCVQRELEKNGLAATVEQFNLKTDEDDDLVLLNYGIDADKFNPIIQECRSLILEKSTWNVVSMAFKRFFNSHEGSAAEIDWPTAQAYEKIDGSLFHLFWYGGEWRCASRGKLNGSGDVSASCPFKTFGELFWSKIPRTDHYLSDAYCYIFELVSPWNRIVTVYKKPALYILTARRMNTLEEESDAWLDIFAEEFGFDRPGRWAFRSLEETKTATEALGVTEEGFVVCDAGRNRIKVKSVSYLTLHKMFNGGEPDLWDLILGGDGDEFLSYFPQYIHEIATKKDFLSLSLDRLDTTYRDNKHAEDQKTFALVVKDLPGSALLFGARKYGHISVRKYWSTLDAAAQRRQIERIEYWGNT